MNKKFLGLFLALVLPLLYVLVLSPALLKPNVNQTAYTLIGFAVFWGLGIGMFLYTRYVEQLPLSTIGWKPLSWKGVLLALVLGILLSLLVPLFTLLTSAVFPTTDQGTIIQVTESYPWWILLLSVFTAGITKEILFRGYALERLVDLTRNKWISGLISLAFFVVIHAIGWNMAHMIGVVLPLGVILTGLYFWKRNLAFVMIVHVVINLPLVFIELLS